MSYKHLTTNERSCIHQFINLGMSIRKIAKALKRAPSTISREIKRNSTKTDNNDEKSNNYFPIDANDKYNERRLNCHRTSKIDDKVKEYIQEKIEARWSPEQISNREAPCDLKVPSTGTIYRLIHKNEIKKVSMKQLRRKGNFKRPSEKRGKFNDGGRTIDKRPKEVYKRKELGHWEIDTVESGRVGHKRKSKHCFVTFAERKSRYYMAILIENRKSENVTPAIINYLSSLPKDLVKTLTFDRGKEFSGYEEIEEALCCKTYFCEAYCAWQKGTNENTNGLLREFYPKGMDLSTVDEKELASNIDLMNNRPRKCLGYETPNEVFFGYLH